MVSGVPLAGLAALTAADLAGARVDPLSKAGMLFLALCAMVAGLAAITVAARSIGDPLRTLRRVMARVQNGEFDARLPIDGGSELGHVQAGFNEMVAGLAERERLQDLFGRHVGRDVAAAAAAERAGVRLGGEEREVAALFVDLVGSTELAAKQPPAVVVALLNRFFAIVVETVDRHGGWVNKFEGDAALCVFGAPTSVDDPAANALAAARELGRRLAAGDPEIHAGIGVSAGTAVAGNIGAENRFEFTVIGDPVNEAARLCELAKGGPGRGCAAGRAVQRATPDESRRWSLGSLVHLRGRDAPTLVAAPVAEDAERPAPPALRTN